MRRRSKRPGAKDLDFKIDLEDAPATIHIARRPLRSILSNLVLNAIKFTEHGSVAVRISSAPARGAEPGPVLEVSDTGSGMSPALIKQAAEPFAQLSRTSARKYRGLGLGLAVVHRNVQALGAQARGQLDAWPRLALRGADPADVADGRAARARGGQRIFSRGERAEKHAPAPAAIQPSPASPRKAAAGTDGGVVVLC